jgi:hypothetical protein
MVVARGRLAATRTFKWEKLKAFDKFITLSFVKGA